MFALWDYLFIYLFIWDLKAMNDAKTAVVKQHDFKQHDDHKGVFVTLHLYYFVPTGQKI